MDLLLNTNLFKIAHYSLAATFNTTVNLVHPFQPILNNLCVETASLNNASTNDDCGYSEL